MAKLSDTYGTDDDGAENGTWVTLRPAVKAGDVAMRVKIRSAHSTKYRTEEQKLQRSFRADYIAGQGYLATEKQDEFDVTLAHRAIVVAWEGVQDDAGADIPCTPGNVKRELTRFPQFRRALYALAKSDETFKPAEQVRAELEGLAKN